jgi:4-amino-4-deoxy-L-arabinose transferase-like glycosyltransferase
LILGLALVAYVALGIGYATATPIWQNPDEPAHFNYVARLAETGTLPELRPGDWDSALLSRLQNGRLASGDSIASIRYESWQPPLYYLFAAPMYRLGPPDEWSTVLRLRVFGVVLGAVTLVLAYLVARRVLPEALAAVVSVTLVGVPMFSAVSASVSADPLANALAALIVLVLVRGRLEPVRTGVLLGLGVLTKLALVIFGPLALWVMLRQSTRPVRDTLQLLVSGVLVMLPWLIHQVTTYGWTDPLATARHAAVVLDQPRFEGLTPEYVGGFATITFHSFWAQFGWMAIPAPERLYWLWAAVTLLAAAGLAWRREWLLHPGWQMLLATIVGALIAYIVYNLAFKQFQGRYLFTAVVPICCLLVAGWATWLPARLKVAGALAMAVLLVGLNAYALVRVLTPGFAPAG